MHDIHTMPRTKDDCLSFTTPESEEVQYTVQCFPARERGVIRNWTYKDLDSADFKARLRSKVPRTISRIYAPSVSHMSGVVLSPDRFTRFFPIDRMLEVRRPGYIKGSERTMLGCDGVQVRAGTASSMTAGGCAWIVLSGLTEAGEDFCAMAHAGRDSLLDKHVIQKGEPSRVHFSVVDALVAYASIRGAVPEKLTLRSFFALHWVAFEHRLDDPVYSKENRKLAEYFQEHSYLSPALKHKHDDIACLCLSTLIRLQANEYRIGTVETGLFTLPVDGDYAYTRHSDPSMRGEQDELRNLVLGYRH